jgi:enoyl-[acyl-carrier protein] reductase II
MRTRLTDVLQIEHPVMLAGMGGVSYARLVAAVSEAGGIGTMGAAPMQAPQMVEEIAKVRELTSKPFGVDLLAALPDSLPARVQDVIDGGAQLFVAGLGVPRDVVDLCHSNNVLVASMCGKVRHAIASVEAGCDIVIAQGTEAGGHTGQIATLALVPQVVDAVSDRVPVVAAGGIVDGRGLAAALALGADGIWVGTRFIATPEAHTVNGYKEKLLELHEDGTTVTKAYTGKTCRVVENAYTREFVEAGGVPEPFPMQVLKSLKDGANHLGGDETSQDIDPDREFWPAGQGAGAITDIVPAGELVLRFVREAEDALGVVQKAFV